MEPAVPITMLIDDTSSSPSLVTAAETSSGATNPRQNDGIRTIPRLGPAGAEEAYAMPVVLQAGRAEPAESTVHDLIDLWESPARTVGATSSSSSRPTAEATSPPSLLPLSEEALRALTVPSATGWGRGLPEPTLAEGQGSTSAGALENSATLAEGAAAAPTAAAPGQAKPPPPFPAGLS